MCMHAQADFGAFQAASCVPEELDFGDFASFASFDSLSTSTTLGTSDDGSGNDAGLPPFHAHPLIPQPDSLTAFGDTNWPTEGFEDGKKSSS